METNSNTCALLRHQTDIWTIFFNEMRISKEFECVFVLAFRLLYQIKGVFVWSPLQTPKSLPRSRPRT